jgi:hypothetical protein
MKVVVNRGVPGALLSPEGEAALEALGAPLQCPRNDASLLAVVADRAHWADHAELCVIEIPDDVAFVVCSDGATEWIAEKHRTWC